MRVAIPSQFFRSAEYLYAILALFLLTQGPVYRMWSQSSGLAGFLSEPSVSHAHFATFLCIQAPGVLLWFRRCNGEWLNRQSNTALVAFLVWLVLTVCWSTFARQSLPEVLAIVTTTGFGLYLADRFTSIHFWLVITGAMAIGVGITWVSVMRVWDGAVNFQEGYWIGIYFNRNSLAPVAGLAIVSCLGVLLSIQRRRERMDQRLAVLLSLLTVTVAVYSAIELWKSKSQTSPLALAIAVSTSGLWLFIQATCRRVRAFRRFSPFSAPLALVVVSIAVFSILRIVGGFGSLSSETTSLNMRRALWSLSWSGFLEKPWQGWGWMAAWKTPDFFRQGNWWAVFDTSWSHNGYHDLLLGGGVLAALLFVTFILLGVSAFGRCAPKEALPRMLAVSFVLAAATQESFFIGSHFLWAVLVAALASPVVDEALVDQKHSCEVTPRSS